MSQIPCWARSVRKLYKALFIQSILTAAAQSSVPCLHQAYDASCNQHFHDVYILQDACIKLVRQMVRLCNQWVRYLAEQGQLESFTKHCSFNPFWQLLHNLQLLVWWHQAYDASCNQHFHDVYPLQDACNKLVRQMVRWHNQSHMISPAGWWDYVINESDTLLRKVS